MRLLILSIALFAFFCQTMQGAEIRDSGIKHSFKIVGESRTPFYSNGSYSMVVNYDSTKVDHLYISELRENGTVKTKTCLLFKGTKFKLSLFSFYAEQAKLIVDGVQSDYRPDGTLGSELLYKEEKLIQKTFFYPDGKRQSQIGGNEKVLNGAYKLWYPNSQLNLSGNYKDNLKDGEFLQFDEKGNLLRQGVYSEGKLISGVPVVPDIVYSNPDKPAQFPLGQVELANYLQKRTKDLKVIKDLGSDEVRYINMKMTISKSGNLDKIDLLGNDPVDHELINTVFTYFPGFIPATVEEVPVRSLLWLNLLYTSDGLQLMYGNENSPEKQKRDSLSGPTYTKVDVMPEFPGGENSLKQYVAGNIRYPVEAATKGIQGDVMVRFVVETDGSISNVKPMVKRNVFLDEEAVRVVRMMPRWRPGRQGGKIVRVLFYIPVHFRLVNG